MCIVRYENVWTVHLPHGLFEIRALQLLKAVMTGAVHFVFPFIVEMTVFL